MITDESGLDVAPVKVEATGTSAMQVAGSADVAEGSAKQKKKPRGKPFARGDDPRRGSGKASGEGGGDAKPFLTFVTQGMEAADKLIAQMMQQQQQQTEKAIEAAEKAVSGPTVIVKTKTPNGVTETKLTGKVHKIFAEVMDTIASGFRNILLVGPAGSGKTTLTGHVTRALNLPVADHPLVQAIAAKNDGVPFASVSCSGGMTESVLTGRLLPTGEHGRFEYHETPFVALFENPGGFLKDEVDGADPNVLLVSNSGIDNGRLDLPNRIHNPVALRHDLSYLFLAANTFGLGANRQYVGRNQLDAAYLDRFVGAVIEMPYDRDLELAIVRQMLGEAETAKWCDTMWTIRESIERTGLRRIWGTRAIKHGARLLASGKAEKKVLARLTTGWTADEKEKAGVKC